MVAREPKPSTLTLSPALAAKFNDLATRVAALEATVSLLTGGKNAACVTASCSYYTHYLPQGPPKAGHDAYHALEDAHRRESAGEKAWQARHQTWCRMTSCTHVYPNQGHLIYLEAMLRA